AGTLRVLHSFPTRRSSDLVLYRAAVHEAPQVGGEAAELLLHLGEAAGVVDRRHDLLAVAHDAAGPQQLFRARVAEGRDPGRVEVDRKSTRLNSSHVKISYA